MKLSNLSVIFVIVMIPIILVLSYYISMQVDTINMQTSYNSKLLDATKEAIESFEINTVEWNEAYSQTADSKRRDILASINTFTTSFANSIGVGGTNKENILTYVPAIAFTLYDGYYIYSPAETKEVIKDDNGVAVIMSEKLVNTKNKDGNNILQGYTKSNMDNDIGKILYQVADDKTPDGTYNIGDTVEKFTLNPENAKKTKSHILKPFASYSARYVSDNADIIVNYTLDNYITIYGTVKENGKKVNVIKEGYLIDTNEIPEVQETLTEKIWYEGVELETIGIDDAGNDIKKLKKEFQYVYADDNTKVYFDEGTPFQVSATGERTDLADIRSQKYKLVITNNGTKYYQALCNYDVNGNGFSKEEKDDDGNCVDIILGEYYTERGDPKSIVNDGAPEITIEQDASARNYYYEAKAFSDWVNDKLKDITIENMQNVEEKSIYGDINSKIFNVGEFNNPEDEGSAFNMHKREVIKQALISDLNQAITAYSRNPEGEYHEYQLPVLTERDWDQILRNVSITTFVQGIPIGLKIYNNYAVATSTSNKEYVNPDEIYLSRKNGDGYYHLPGCKELEGDNIIGYRNTDYVVKSYYPEENNKDKIEYYYKHEDLANQECYYCLVQRELFKEAEGNNLDNQKKAYETALARERYVSHEFR